MVRDNYAQEVRILCFRKPTRAAIRPNIVDAGGGVRLRYRLETQLDQVRDCGETQEGFCLYFLAINHLLFYKHRWP